MNVVQDAIVEIDFKKQQLIGQQAKYGYDELIIGTGATTADFNIPGVKEHAFYLRFLEEAIKIRCHIEETVAASHPFVRQVLLDYVRTGGKMLRPALVLIMSTLNGNNIDQDAINTAAAVELIHLASIVHDDIIDGAPIRRGKKTLSKQAVLAGDLLLSKALTLTGRLDTKTNRVAMARLCESELEQDANVGNFFIIRTACTRRIAGKTASLFALSCYLGSALATEDQLVRMRAHRLGYALGMAFQIQDDNLDYDGEAVLPGKEIAWDLKTGFLRFLSCLHCRRKRKPVPPSSIRISMNRSCRSQRRTLTPSFPWWSTIEVLKKPKESSSSIASGLSVILKLWIPPKLSGCSTA
ncbi:MAG: Heptaprenyl diphosphate synthase component 2 [Spirochaetes bacterium ADurb.Bin315]|nr:MAG: Heptaprenyl diphosphate synthase component 2 [Spirochaetes bacterium ADurb.Bin315]